jgi:hypothetical protein
LLPLFFLYSAAVIRTRARLGRVAEWPLLQPAFYREILHRKINPKIKEGGMKIALFVSAD